MYSCTLSLTSALDGGGWVTPRPGLLGPVRRPITHCTRGCFGPRTGRDVCGKPHPPLQDRLAGSKSLYRMNNPSPPTSKTGKFDSVPSSSEPKQVPGPASLAPTKHGGGVVLVEVLQIQRSGACIASYKYNILQ